ncbi:MAG: TlpA disulfide reductase family protein [Myxococcota bacterium]
MIALWALLSAHASEVTGTMTEAWWYLDRGCAHEAWVRASEALRAAPDDAGAHRARVNARIAEGWTQRLEITAEYEALHATYPDLFGIRVGLASALAQDPQSPACTRIAELLADRAEQPPEARYHAVRALLRAAGKCSDLPKDRLDAEIEAIGAEGVSAAATLAVWNRLQRDPLSVGADEMLASARSYPDRAPSYARELEKAGAAGRKSRAALVDLAKTWLGSDDLVLVLAGARVLKASGRDTSDVLARIDAEAPCRPREAYEPPSDLVRTIYEAGKQPTHELALDGLDAIAKKIPASGPERTLWQRERAERLEALGRDAEWYAAIKDASQASPDDGRLANQFAWAASERGQDLEAALTAITHVLPSLDTETWDTRMTLEGWQGVHRNRVANWADTRGWLLHQLGRDEEAREALQRAIVATKSGNILAHTGIVLHALGEDDAAYAHLRAAYAIPGGVRDATTDAEARPHLEALWLADGGWHPDGFEGWVGSLAPRKEGAKDGAKPEPRATGPRNDGPLVGSAFPMPDAAGLAKGATRVGLRDPEHLLVVDLWATWCGPCVDGMPHLAEVQAAYADRGVRVVGLSVDKEAKTARAFMSAAPPAYDLGWVGLSAYQTLVLSGIPELFVIDRDGVVRHRITGYGRGDTRLERALDAMLATSEP